jgi:hypothetical protein
MRDAKTLTTALLAVSAAVLMTVMVLTTDSKPAHAGEASISAGDYVLVTGQYNADIEILYVVDRAAQRMNAYVLDLHKNDLILKDQINLKLAFQQARQP